VTDDRTILTTRVIPEGEPLIAPWSAQTAKPLTAETLRAAIVKAQKHTYERPQLIVSPFLVDRASEFLGRHAVTEHDLWEAASIEWEQATAAQAAWSRSWRGRLIRAWRWTSRPFRVSTWRRPKHADWWGYGD
jgi:hypothetical protein